MMQLVNSKLRAQLGDSHVQGVKLKWVWLKNQELGVRRCWSLFPFRGHFGYLFLSHSQINPFGRIPFGGPGERETIEPRRTVAIFFYQKDVIDQLFGVAGSSLSMIGACHGGLGVGTGCFPFFYKAKMGVPQRRFPPHMMGLWFPCSSFGMSWSCTLSSDGTDLN